MSESRQISEEMAESLLLTLRGTASFFHRNGMLTQFNRGQISGMLAVVRAYMPARRWIVQGIENEIEHMFRQARES